METSRCAPVNAYGRTKLEAEQYVRSHWERRIILRTSIIYGPDAPIKVGRRDLRGMELPAARVVPALVCFVFSSVYFTSIIYCPDAPINVGGGTGL